MNYLNIPTFRGGYDLTSAFRRPSFERLLEQIKKGGLGVVLRNIVYDFYSKDLSVKATTTKREKMMRVSALDRNSLWACQKKSRLLWKGCIRELP